MITVYNETQAKYIDRFSIENSAWIIEDRDSLVISLSDPHQSNIFYKNKNIYKGFTAYDLIKYFNNEVNDYYTNNKTSFILSINSNGEYKAVINNEYESQAKTLETCLYNLLVKYNRDDSWVDLMDD